MNIKYPLIEFLWFGSKFRRSDHLAMHYRIHEKRNGLVGKNGATTTAICDAVRDSAVEESHSLLNVEDIACNSSTVVDN